MGPETCASGPASTIYQKYMLAQAYWPAVTAK